MKLSYIVQRLKNGSTLNVSNDFFDDIDFVYHINVSLNIIFSKMNSLGNWYFSNKTESLTADGGWTQKSWTLSSDVSRFWQVSWDWAKLTQATVSLDITDSEDYEDTAWFMLNWSKSIRTTDAFGTLDVVYSRFPKWHDYLDLEQDLDLPDQLVWALEFYVFWRLMPVFYEQGSSLANNYLSQAEKTIEEYALNIGLSSPQNRFTA